MIPIWRMISLVPEQVRLRARRWADHLGMGEVITGKSTVGGGSLPEETLPTFLLALRVPQPNRFLALLRAAAPPVIARVEEDQVLLDPRTVFLEEEPALLAALRDALASSLSKRRGK